MGVSTDAILFYGYCWDAEYEQWPWKTDSAEDDDDDNDDDDDDEGWEERYARAKGCLPPSLPFPEREVTPTRANNYSVTPTDYTDDEQAIIDQHRAYWRKKEKIAKTSPCEVGSHCSASCPMAYVAVKKSLMVSHRGFPKKFSELTIDPTWNQALAEFCEVMEIKVGNKKPAWWLVSYWSE